MSMSEPAIADLIARIRTNFPAKLRALPVWLLWRYRPGSPGEKPKKVPHYVNGVVRHGTLDTPDDRAQLVDFETAAAALNGRYAGLGVALGPVPGEDLHLSGIDLDRCYNCGELTGSAQQVLLAGQTYAELSPGGEGLHLIGTGAIGTVKKDERGLEIYDCRRFFTATGAALNSAGLGDLSDAAAMARKLWGEASKANGAAGADTKGAHYILHGGRNSFLSDEAFRLRKQGSSVAQIEQILGAINAARCRPPLPDAEVGQIAKGKERVEADAQPEALDLTPVSAWAHKEPPPPREWIWENFIPARRVISFGGDGGHGKTTIAIQIGVHHAIGRPLYGHAMKAGRVLGIFCEDEQDELERRVRAACTAENIDLAAVTDFVALSRDGQQNMLCAFERDVIVLTPFYHQLEATIENLRPATLILDVTADFFAGDFMSTPHVRQFIKVGLGAWCVRYGITIVLLSHPSATGLNSGEGDGFSRAWNNTVRGRLFLRRPRTEDPEDAIDRRILEVKKSNYGPIGVTVPLIWRAGVFVPDSEPMADNRGEARKRSSGRGGTRLAIAVLQYLREQEKAGVITVKYGAIIEHLVKTAALPTDIGKNGIRELAKYEANRKQLSRALEALKADGLVHPCQAPRGSYRLVPQGVEER